MNRDFRDWRACRRLRFGALSCALFVGMLCPVVVHAAAERSIALPPVLQVRSATLKNKLHSALTFYLRERLGGDGTFALVDGWRVQAVMEELEGVSTEQRFEAFCDFLPVDAVVDYRISEADPELVVHVHQHNSVRSQRWSLADTTQITVPVKAAAAFVFKALELSPTQRSALLQERFASADGFDNYYVGKVLNSAWPMNTGETKLKYINRSRPAYAQHVDFQALVLESVAEVLSSKTRVQTYANTALNMAWPALQVVLDTPRESAAYNVARYCHQTIERDLLALTAPLIGADELGELGDLNELGDDADAIGLGRAGDKASSLTRGQRLSALRILGHSPTFAAFQRIAELAESEEPAILRAVAGALVVHKLKLDMRLPDSKRQSEDYADTRPALLVRFSKSSDSEVAFLAHYALWQEGGRPQQSPTLLRLAKALLSHPTHGTRAHEAFFALATSSEIPQLRDIEARAADGVRSGAAQALLRLGAIPVDDLLPYLQDHDSAVVTAACTHLAEADEITPELRAAIVKMANDPYGPVMRAARLVIGRLRPTDPVEQHAFDLVTEHTYTRLSIVDSAGAANDQAARALLTKAASNDDLFVRAQALKWLSAIAPDQARPLLYDALSDSSPWVRLHAAAYVEQIADTTGTSAISSALEGERDRATRAYLQGALAKASGKAPPPALPSVNSVDGKNNVTWSCELGLYAVDSPFDAYYCLSPSVNDVWRRAHAAGKVFMPRLNPIIQPGQLMVNTRHRAAFWRAIDDEVKDEDLAFMDGFVFGEETMSLAIASLWHDGWPLFCRDAKISVQRVAGSLDNLSKIEKIAWENWATERSIDGFNLIYDYVKLKYGKLRPGIQVCTFLPGESTAISRTAAARWKFDIGGIYDYRGDNRVAAYGLVRRFKTIWPDRKVLWLSLGVGGYELNPVKYNQKTPQLPVYSRSRRCYADSMTAWMAGADTGWFSIWAFVEEDFAGSMHELSGIQVHVESIAPRSPLLLRGIAMSQRGVKEKRVHQAMAKAVPETPTGAELAADEGDELGGLEEDTANDKLVAGVDEELKTLAEQMRIGFNFYQKYVYDCVRVFGSLPRTQARPKALYVRPRTTVWTLPGSDNPLVPAAALLSEYDFLCDINMVAHIDLTRYRAIILHDPGRLRDATIEALTEWLKWTPGLLYIHRDIAADNRFEDATVDDLDGNLTKNWPWESDIEIVRVEEPSAKPKLVPTAVENTFLRIFRLRQAIRDGWQEPDTAFGQRAIQATVASDRSRFKLKGERAVSLLAVDGEPTLVRWFHPGYRGIVFFDSIEHASTDYIDLLDNLLLIFGPRNKDGEFIPALPRQEHSAGLHQSHSMDSFLATATSPYYRGVQGSATLPGIELLTGQPDPTVGGSRSAALTTSQFVGKYVAVIDGFHVLSSTPFHRIEATENGVLIKSDGLVRITSAKPFTLTPTDSTVLPAIPNDKKANWLIDSNAPGTLTIDTGDQAVTYYRCKAATVAGQ